MYWTDKMCFPVALLFLAILVPSQAQKGGTGETEAVVQVTAGAPLTVECRLRPEQRADWRRDGGELPPEMRATPEAAPALPGEGDARLTARLRAPAARPHHAGLYTCTPERDHRVRVLVTPARLDRLDRAGSPAGDVAAVADVGRSDDLPEFLYDVRASIVLHCELPNDAGLAYVWTKNETTLEEVWEMKDRYQLEQGGAKLKVAKALEDDFGNYTCALAGQSSRQQWAVRGRPHLKLPANSNVVEGQKLKLTCKVLGKPYPRVQWLYNNGTDEKSNFTALTSRGELVDSEQGVPDGTLIMESAARSDAGRYQCVAEHAPAPATTQLRVKDMYAALWPFLGICAEVFILCAIILVYEKRRTKPDLDDSDADNHDQKKS